MKLLGLACGSTGGNSEILLKAALMAAEEAGLEVEMVRVADLALPAGRPGTVPPDVPDDRPWMVEKLIACDALLVAVPVYTRSPPGTLKVLLDRAFGPRVDVASVLRVRAGQQGNDPRYKDTVIDERLLKPRVAGLLSLGGATSTDWVTFGLPLLHMTTFSMHIAVVDQVQLLGSAMPGTVLFDAAAIQRAQQMGRNVAAEIGKPFDAALYHGPEGVCPICHCDLIVPLAASAAECATCAARGELRYDGGQPRLIVTDEGRARSILTLAGKHHHQDEIDAVSATVLPRMKEVPPLRAPYDGYDRLASPPSRGG